MSSTSVEGTIGPELQGQSAESKAQILEENCLRKDPADEQKKMIKKAVEAGSASKEETTLPKLSAADFKVYNSMAEHMEYFVSLCAARLWLSYI
jgi:hypothetical protein